jgi:hypothetical protein
MRLRLILVLAALLVSSCSDDDSLDAFVEVEPEIVIETEALDVDIDALEEAATDTDAEMDEPAPIEIPDDALDLSGMDQVALDIQDNAFTQRVVVVSAGHRDHLDQPGTQRTQRPARRRGGVRADLDTRSRRKGRQRLARLRDPR